MHEKNKSHKRYTAFCLHCFYYLAHLDTDSKREAERWCTSHSNAYGHETSIADNKQLEK